MLYVTFGLLIILFFLLFGWVLKLSVFSPLILNSVGWLAAFVSGIFFYDQYYPITTEVFVAWVIWFTIVSILFVLLDPGQKSIFKIKATLQSYTIRLRYEWVIVFFCIVLAWRIWVIGSTGPEHFFLNLRLASNGIEGFGQLGLVARFYPLIFSLFIIEWLLLSSGRQRVRLYLLLWMAFYAIGTMGKFAFLTPALVVAFSLALHQKISFKQLLPLGVVSMLIMLVLHFLRSGSFALDDLGYFFSVYTYSPIVALGYLDPSHSLIFGENTFRLYYAVAHALGVTTPPAEVIISYVEVPSLTNVYTGLFPYYHDFGLVGVFFAALFWGIFFGAIYYFALKGYILALFVYAVFLVVLIASFFHDLFFMVLSGHLQTVIAIVFIGFLMLRKKHD